MSDALQEVRDDWGSDVCLTCGHDLGTEESCLSCHLARVQAGVA